MRLKVIGTQTLNSIVFNVTYLITKYSLKFKKKYPKKIILSGKVLNTGEIINGYNVGTLPSFIDNFTGYIFTYDKKLKTKNILIEESSKADLEIINSIHTIPICLDQYLTNSSCDLIIRISPKCGPVPYSFTNNIICKLNTNEIMEFTPQKLRNRICKYVSLKIGKLKTNLETWIKFFLATPYFNPMGMPIIYGDTNIKSNDLLIEYDFRPFSFVPNNYEFGLIKLLEDAFEPGDLQITIMNTFNDIVPQIMKELDKHKLSYKITKVMKYKDEEEPYIISIETAVKNLRKIKINYTINDCF
jgi:hypothetical protein